jgi:hypothetical protein
LPASASTSFDTCFNSLIFGATVFDWPMFLTRYSITVHLAFLDRKLMSDDILVDAVYRIFTSRAAVELEKKAVEQELARLCQTAVVA